MTITQSFLKMLEQKGYGIPGQNIFLYRVPNSMKTQTELYWIIPSGGQPVSTNKTGELVKAYQFLVYFRSNSAEKIDKTLAAMEEQLNCSGCVELEGFELVRMTTTQFPTDQDLDSENRMVGMLQVQLEIYKGCKL